MKTKSDWIALVAAAGLVVLIRLMLTSDSLILPAFLGALGLQLIVARSARPSPVRIRVQPARRE